MLHSDGYAGTQPLSQRTHLGRSSKAAAQKKLLEVSDGEEEEEADIDDAASSGIRHCNILQKSFVLSFLTAHKSCTSW